MKDKWSILLLFVIACSLLSNVDGWSWICDDTSKSCQRVFPSTSYSNLYNNVDICRLFCDSYGNIWPQPTQFIANKIPVNINVKNAIFSISANSPKSQNFLRNIEFYFKSVIDSSVIQDCTADVYKFVVKLSANANDSKLVWNTSELYEMQINTDDSLRTVEVNINGETVFGVRHAVETLLQLIQVNEENDQTCYLTMKKVVIHDKPFYKHRGLLLDSARNFLSIDVIKKNIVAMAMSKMNVLHWHLTDSQSFPWVSSSVPNMSRYGAYSSRKIYHAFEIRDLIDFGEKHGVRIIPEIDGPAHAGSGWQWGPEAGLGNLVLCYNQLPYKSYCVQPPCGQMNPANPNLYEVLEQIYNDIVELWNHSEVFHMGGDEVFIPCWNSSQEIINYIGTADRSERTFLKLWAEFQRKALERFDKANNHTASKAILWTSHLTEVDSIESYLPKDRYIIQTWVPKSDPLPEQLIKLGYELIISTKDSWYLDHGFWGNTQYYSWSTVYRNRILEGPFVLGGEVCMWGELVDDNNVESRVWPRAAAAAERLWSNPSTNSIDSVAPRFYSHNERLARRGLRTSSVTPEFCTQSYSDCTG